MGRLRGLVAGGSLMISIFVFLFSETLSFAWLFFVPGAIGLLLGMAGLLRNPLEGSRPPEQKKRILPQKRYWLFYILNLLMGGRRIIFTVFAVFLMVEQFGFSVRTVSLLFMFNYAVNWLFNPMVGRIINRFGERRLMTMEYLCAFIIFLGYAYTHNEYVLVLLYVFDSLTFNFSIAVRTFFQKIAFSQDAAPNMAIAQTINHIPAVSIPAVGGWMWVYWGYQSVFLFGACLTLISLGLAQLVDREISRKSTQEHQARTIHFLICPRDAYLPIFV
jgi:predicted MFS family arabinose efflux permease